MQKINYLKKKKNVKREYRRKRYYSMSEDKKQNVFNMRIKKISKKTIAKLIRVTRLDFFVDLVICC